MSFIGLLRTLEQITRPPRLGHDVDAPLTAQCFDEYDDYPGHRGIEGEPHYCTRAVRHDGDHECGVCKVFWERACRSPADCAAYDCQGDCEPPARGGIITGHSDEIPAAARSDGYIIPKSQLANVRIGFAGCGRDMESYAEGFNEGFAEAQRQQDPDWEPDDDDTPNPAEPGLTPDELVGVRGLLQERYGEVCTCLSWGNPNWPHRHGCPADPQHTSASNHTGTGAEPAPSPTIVQSAPPPTVDGEGPSACEHSPAPAEGRPTSPSPRDDGILAGDRPGSERVPGPGHPDDAAAEWIGEAVPRISEVLSHHVTVPLDNRKVMCLCLPQEALIFPNNAAWRAHVAPLVANNIAPQPK